jgi:hypothetical protein
MPQQFSGDVTTDGVRGHGDNFPLGLLGGIIAAIIGAVIWMGFAVTAGSLLHVIPIGIMAIVVGALVGFTIRILGNGRGLIFGLMGALLAFLGCLGGEVLTVVQQSTGPSLVFVDAMKAVDLTQLVPTIFSKMDVMTYIAYGVSVYEGFTISRQK